MYAPPANIVRSGQASRTALAVATLRAAHQLLDAPLVLPDPLALPLLGAVGEARLRADPAAWNDPVSRGLRAALVARSRFAEDELRRCVADGVGQYVVLGAGLDTFAYRCADLHARLRNFEVDHPGSQRWKQQLLADAGIGVPDCLRFVALDFERDDLATALAQAGFRADRPACISWMGVTPYLTADAVRTTLGALAGLAAGSRVCFDHRLPAALLGPVEQAVDAWLGQQAAAAGEPWLSAFDPGALQRDLLALGFASATTIGHEQLNARYFAGRTDGLQVGAGLRIVCAGLGSGALP